MICSFGDDKSLVALMSSLLVAFRGTGRGGGRGT
ncbi:hypothetical protein SOVF_093950 [Spinacia oleracea]|nr:hypothetical protein SOVF_093950 [Spinacia oleracea]